MKLGRMAQTALFAMRHVAAKKEKIAAASEIAAAYGISKFPLAKVLQLLARARLLTADRGVKGGYRLARPAAKISVRDIIEAIDGPIGINQCALAGGPCPVFSICRTGDRVTRAFDTLVKELTQSTLEEMTYDLDVKNPAPKCSFANDRKPGRPRKNAAVGAPARARKSPGRPAARAKVRAGSRNAAR